MLIFGMMIFVLMLAVAGLGVDLMRYETHRARLQSTLDRAVLAAASMDQTLPPAEVVQDYFDKAGLGAFLGEVRVTDNITGRRVAATANITVPTTFMRLLDVQYLNAPAAGAAEEAASQSEISLVLDVSGSMGRTAASGNSKIHELRVAAREFVNIVLCDPENPQSTTNCVVPEGKVSVSLVPYSEQVVAGEDLLSRFYVTNEHTDSSCVTFTDDELRTTAMTPFASPMPSWIEPHKRTGNIDPWSGSYTASDYRRSCRPAEPWREISPLMSDAATLRNRINALGASGNTSIDVGMKWGTVLLDPASRPVVDSLIADSVVSPLYSGRPNNWRTGGILKVVVLMTDGVNTSQHYLYDDYREGLSDIYKQTNSDRWSIYHSGYNRYYWDSDGSWHDDPDSWEYSDDPSTSSTSSVWWHNTDAVEQQTFPEVWKEKSWRWFRRFSWLGSPGTSYGNTLKNTRLHNMCEAAKDNGIIVFAVGFEVTSSSADVMRDCATEPSYYFDADGTNLSAAFASIARQISKLRLVN